VCSFDCIYCECGFTPKSYEKKVELPSRKEVREKLELKLKEMIADKQLPDVITFAGNGEPTLHPEFGGIIDDTIALRDALTPNARIAVLANATMNHKPEVFNALLKIKDNIQKLDSAFEETVKLIDGPRGNFSLEKTIEQLMAFKGKLIIQTMFIRGSFKGQQVDNTTEKEISAWLDLVQKINPTQVMIYTIARDTPIDTLKKVPLEALNAIANRLREKGRDVQVSG
jgi:wyosine [tRNA(Phe)-imidazoG37] synthetase (radical SAM superfamily)